MPIHNPLHPGEHVKHEIEYSKLSIKQVADCLGIKSIRLSKLLKGDESITADMAIRLGKFFGNGATIWLYLQYQYDDWLLAKGVKVGKVKTLNKLRGDIL